MIGRAPRGVLRAEVYDFVMRILVATLALLALFSTAACGPDVSCQSGPKYGTQCYSPGSNPQYITTPSSPPPASSGNPSVMPSSPSR
jgi:hypothetical protein